jgi:hypothetical protein
MIGHEESGRVGQPIRALVVETGPAGNRLTDEGKEALDCPASGVERGVSAGLLETIVARLEFSMYPKPTISTRTPSP